MIAGYPVVGLKATLLDGTYHPVDSSEMAFIMAANLAYKAALPEASPVILEPIGTLKAHVPADNTGDIMGESKRRGRVLGMNPDEDGLQRHAEVPMAELQLHHLPASADPGPRLVPAVVEQAKKLGNLDDNRQESKPLRLVSARQLS